MACEGGGGGGGGTELTKVKAGSSNSNHCSVTGEKKTELRADTLPDKLQCNKQKCEENVSKMNRFPQQILFPSKTKKPFNSWPISGRFGEIADP